MFLRGRTQETGNEWSLVARVALLIVIHMSELEALVLIACACFPEDIARVKRNDKLVLPTGHSAPLVFRDLGKWRSTFLAG